MLLITPYKVFMYEKELEQLKTEYLFEIDLKIQSELIQITSLEC